MRPKLIGLVLLLVIGIAAAYTIYQGSLVHVIFKVKPVNVTMTTVEVALPDLNPGQSFDSGWHNVSDAIVTNVGGELYIWGEGLQEGTDEWNATKELRVYIVVFNESEKVIGVDFPKENLFNTRAIFSQHLPAGSWNVGVKVYGQAGYPTNETEVDFKVVAKLGV